MGSVNRTVLSSILFGRYWHPWTPITTVNLSLNTTLQNLISSIQTVRLLVPVHQDTLYFGSPVQDSAAYLGIWQYAVVAVVLEAPAADFKYHSQFLVGIIAFPVQRRLVAVTYFLHPFRKVFQRREKGSHARVVFRCQQPDVVVVSHKHATLGC